MTPHTNRDSEETKLRQHSSQQERQPEAQAPSSDAPGMAGRIPLRGNPVGRANRAVQRFVQYGTLMTGPSDDEPLVREAIITEGVVNSGEAPQEKVPVQRFWGGLMDIFSGEDEYKPITGGMMDPLSPMPKSGGLVGGIAGMLKGMDFGGGGIKGGGGMEPGTLKGGGYHEPGTLKKGGGGMEPGMLKKGGGMEPLDPSIPYPKPKSGGMVGGMAGGIADMIKKLNFGGIKGGGMEPGTLKESVYDEPGTLKKGGGYYEPGMLKGGGYHEPGTLKKGGGGMEPGMLKKGGSGMEPGTLKGRGLLDPLDPSAPYPKPKSGGVVGGIADMLKKLNPGGIKGGNMEPESVADGWPIKWGVHSEPGTLKPGGGTSLPPTGLLMPEEWEAM